MLIGFLRKFTPGNDVHLHAGDAGDKAGPNFGRATSTTHALIGCLPIQRHDRTCLNSNRF